MSILMVVMLAVMNPVLHSQAGGITARSPDYLAGQAAVTFAGAAGRVALLCLIITPLLVFVPGKPLGQRPGMAALIGAAAGIPAAYVWIQFMITLGLVKAHGPAEHGPIGMASLCVLGALTGAVYAFCYSHLTARAALQPKEQGASGTPEVERTDHQQL